MSKPSSIPRSIVAGASSGAQRRRGRSLRAQLVLLVALLLGAIALALLLLLPAQIDSRSRGLVEARAMGIATLLAKATGPALEFEDEASAIDRLSQMASTPDAMYATVLRADGSALATWRADDRQLVAVASAAMTGATIADSVLHVLVPIVTKGGTTGSLAVGFTLEELERERRAAFRLVAIASAIVFAVGLLIAFSIGTVLVRPITQMTAVALKISEGETVDPSATALARERDDEVGTMARAFATMLATLDRQRTFLECQSEASGDGILIVSDRQEVISCNRRLLELWPFPGGVVKADFVELVTQAAGQVVEPEAFLARIQEILAQPDAEFTDEVRALDGRVFERYAVPIKSGDGTHLGRGWYLREITDRKRAEDQIRALNSDLERRVEERTRALEHANQELAARLAQLRETQRALIEASRKSGMADVATAVLHNVGNVLNSVNVSANLVLERHRASRVSGLAKVAELIEAHKDRLGDFFARDPRGLKLPSYLAGLVDLIAREREVVGAELASLQKNVDHIKVIVSRQQAHAKLGGMEEAVRLEDLLDDALDSLATTYARHGIAVIRAYGETRAITCDRHKAYQIVINFLTNAKDALESKPRDDRRVTVRTAMAGADQVVLEVEDSGAGIAPEDLKMIFHHGFTTKQTGHGFGLHSSACFAEEMDGAVAVESRGVGLGARFRLTMPVTRKVAVRAAG